MRLYKLFIEVNPKYSEQILKFISDYCFEIRGYIGNEKTLECYRIINITTEQEKKIERQIYNRLSLKNLGEQAKAGKDICKGCYLCDRQAFTQKRSNLKDIIENLNSKYISNAGKLEILNKIINDINIDLKLNQKPNGSIDWKKSAKNLYQDTQLDLIEDYVPKIEKIDDESEYFRQIAQILLSTKDFINDIHKIREAYLEKYYIINQPTNRFVRKFDKENKKYFDYGIIYNELGKIREKYKLRLRWIYWLSNILFNDFESNSSIALKGIPDGTIYRDKILVIKDNKLVPEITVDIVGDETKEVIKLYKEEYGEEIDISYKKRHRKPILEFEKYLRWYKLKQDGNNFYEIYHINSSEFPEDWEEFKDHKKQTEETIFISDQKLTIDEVAKIDKKIKNRIKKAINLFKNRIYKQLK
jgi:hypothetical protein